VTQPTTNDVREFFDRIADTYSDKCSGTDAFHEYFFRERLAEATRGLDLSGKRVLDIGAGTGNLYDRLVEIDPDIDYYATDISPAMLANSRIPIDRRFVGPIEDVSLPVPDFDLVFLLGVTSYLTEPETASLFARVHELLTPGGLVVVTFTNAASLDWKLRRTAKFFGRWLMPARTVLGQTFTTNARHLTDVRTLLGERFTVSEVRYLNHTVFPLNQVLRSASVGLARKIHGRNPDSALMDRLSSDFLLVLSKKS
jgi:SAM-dependent methyltransferase